MTERYVTIRKEIRKAERYNDLAGIAGVVM